ncbi:MAG: polysaccharide biosynthesis tyrosine autokinase [Blastocatellia bacterium]|nr:polysaccharide biosynthesis tyrosine autokinase [Blastocatellia bacterium]MCS7156518.1 polysaccharide biosynthesis tyrosine autokinase [Blastocatellia bacterium]MCX7751741.1 polysaccharide biosynthesis tyrosine autokinase [Blastocatellia bacterium]MDW8168842.1 polysaccharide biosynthesis tyrosine autokinase [Acidobacteriota bacterium]MDW8257444.1 polysaccharide biosynthesis tyrosine autokinase [Acidobacteriota bacterium]
MAESNEKPSLPATPPERSSLQAPGAASGPVMKFYPASVFREEEGRERDVHLLDYWRVIKKRRWIVLSVLLVVVTIVTIRMYQLPVIYEATGRIIINPQLPLRVTRERETSADLSSNDAQYLETQQNVLRSRELARRVIEALHLERHPEFADITTRVADPDRRRVLLIDRFLANLKVELVRNTRVVAVTYSAHDPQLAARAVNELFTQYGEYMLEARSDSTRKATEWLQEQLALLRDRAEKAQEELVRYSRENEIVQLSENQTITVERLADLNRRLIEAETDRIRAETLYRLSREGEVDALPPVLADPQIQALNARLAELRQELAQLNVEYQPTHPRVARVREQIAEVERQLVLAKRRILANIEAEYKAAVRRESDLRAALERQRAETLRQNERAIELSLRKREVEVTTQLYEGLLEKLNDVKLLSTLTTTNVQILDKAEIPLRPARPRKLFNIGLSVLVGLILGVGLALFVEYLDNTVKSAEDVDRLLGLPVLGLVPALESLERKRWATLPRLHRAKEEERPVLISQRQRSSFAEAFRTLRTSVLLSHAEHPPRTILFTSSSPGEGKTTTAVNTAISLAQMGARVLLIDGDLRKPGLHKALNVKNHPGLSAYLTRPLEVDAVILHQPAENLFVIPAGAIPPNPSELLGSAKMRELLAQVSERYDFILVDSPPASTPDALVLSALVDGVILIIRCGETPRELVHRAHQALLDVNARIFGVVLNRVDVTQDGYSYYYRYYYASDREAEEREERAGTPPTIADDRSSSEGAS